MTDVLLYIAGVLLVVLGVAVAIGLHEIGHLVPAKKFGLRVPQYMVGFGPTVWSTKRGETEYGIKAIPLGGYIRMIGMFPPRPGDDPTTMRMSSTGRMSQLVDEARKVSLEEMRPGDEDRVFYRLAPWKKIIIMLGGPTMNLVLAVFALTLVVTAYGVAVPKDGAKIVTVYECVVSTAELDGKTACEAGDPLTPAAEAGLKPGDLVVSVAGAPVETVFDLTEAVRPRAGEPTEIVVKRDGEQQTLTLTPTRNELPKLTEDGEIVVGDDGRPVLVETGFIGVQPRQASDIERQSPIVAASYSWDMFTTTAGVMLHLPQKMMGVAEAAFGDAERQLDSPVSVVGIGRIAGEATSGGISWLPSSPAALAAFLMQLFAGLNMALFVFNLIPLLPLDGGHVAGAAWEWIKRGAARLLGRPDPGYVDVAKALPVAYAVASVILAMSVLLIYADIVNPINLG